MVSACRDHRTQFFPDWAQLGDALVESRDPLLDEILDGSKIAEVQKKQSSVQRLRYRASFFELPM